MGRTPRRDVVAGVTVGVVALPLALAFGITSGAGAAAGLTTAIVAGAVAAVFGGSNLQVSGPTGAMTVVLVPIVASHGAGAVLTVGFLAGLLLIAMAALGLGRYVRLVPLPVIEGFTVGIAIIIALQQVPTALGVSVPPGHVVEVAARAVLGWTERPAAADPLVAAAVAAVILIGARVRPAVPFSLVGIVLATVLTWWAGLPVALIGDLPTVLPVPSLPPLAPQDLRALALPALAVAVLAALESLLSATVADGMSVSERHDPDRELFGQGLANLAAPLFGGIPATAAIARTAVNVRSGAASRLAALVHAGVLLVFVLALAPLVSRIPLAALGGVLLATTVRMVEVSSLRALLRSSRSDAAVLVVTTAATVALDLVQAVILGIVVAGALALRQMARAARLEEEPLDVTDHSAEERDLLARRIVAFRLDGPLFFGGAHQALLDLTEVSNVSVVVLRMSRVVTLDATGAAVLRDTIRRLEQRGVTVLLSGVRERHETVLRALGVHESLAHERHLFATTPEAIAHARVHAARVPHSA